MAIDPVPAAPALADLLECPQCHGRMSLREAVPVCEQCGYSALRPVECPEYGVELFDPVLEIAWELTCGWNRGRAFLHACTRHFVEPRGVVLDLGAGKTQSYRRFFKVQPDLYLRADGVPENEPDLLINFEQPLPLQDNSVDTIISFNLLEHIYQHRALLAEMRRVLKPDGTLYFYVPYLVRIHGSPHDYFRYTHMGLHRLMEDAGFSDITVYAAGGYARFIPEIYKRLRKIGIGYLLYPVNVGFLLIDRLINLISPRYMTQLPCGYFAVIRGEKVVGEEPEG